MSIEALSLFATRLLQARERRAWSLRELASRIGGAVSAAALNKYEHDEMRPSPQVLDAICEALQITEDFLERPLHASLGELKFRKRSALGVKAEASLKSHAEDFFERYAELEDLLGLEPGFQNPLADRVIESAADVEAAALALRKAWNLGLGPISSTVGLLEKNHLMVHLDKAPKEFDGFAGKLGNRDVVALNATFPTDRLRLDAMHELAHVVLVFPEGRFTEKEIESLCMRFAGAMLIPQPIFPEVFGEKRQHTSVKELVQLKATYGMSCAAIMMRASELGLIAESMMTRFWIGWRYRKYHKKDPGRCLFDEHTRRFDLLLMQAVAEDRISIAKAALLANVPEEEFREQLEILP